MRTLINSQVAILVSLFAAIALTLTACGGGSSSSSAGGSSLNAATVSGTVSNGGLARMEIDGNLGLLLAVSDLLVPVARADGVANVPVTVDCSASGGETKNTVTDANGNFSVTLDNVGTGDCVITVNNEASQDVTLRAGERTEVEVSMSGGSVRFVSVDQDSSDDSGPGFTVTGEVEDDDSSVASADEISEDDVSDADSDVDSVDDESDDDSDSPDAESDDDSSELKGNV